MTEYNDYDFADYKDDGRRQRPILTPEQQKAAYQAEKNFWNIYWLMMPGWITHRHNDMYL